MDPYVMIGKNAIIDGIKVNYPKPVIVAISTFNHLYLQSKFCWVLEYIVNNKTHLMSKKFKKCSLVMGVGEAS